MLVRRAIEPGYGLWVFPGGYVDRGEEITSAAIREAREESGLDVRIDSLVNIYSYGGRSPIIIVYAATALGGELCAATTSASRRGCSRSDEIPWESLAFRSTTEALAGLFQNRAAELETEIAPAAKRAHFCARRLKPGGILLASTLRRPTT